MKKARILTVDDHPLVREGCKSILGNTHEIVGAVADGRSLMEAALRLKPDLIVLDISIPSLNGLEAARQIKAALPEVKLLFFTMHSERSYMQAAFEAGAAGYLLKSEEPHELLRAVQQVLTGQLYLPKGLPVGLRNTNDPERVAKTLMLTPREREVLQLIAEGKSTKDIAHILEISAKTVEYHRENIKRKLGETTIAGLTRSAIVGGLV
jgi:DNA-binding NarL/FixJ family response regulator